MGIFLTGVACGDVDDIFSVYFVQTLVLCIIMKLVVYIRFEIITADCVNVLFVSVAFGVRYLYRTCRI